MSKNNRPAQPEAQENNPPTNDNAAELARLTAENNRLKTELEAAKPKPRETSGKLDKALIAKAQNICSALKAKYAGASKIANSLDVAAQHAYNVWEKAAVENPRTGAAQLEGAEPTIEGYFRHKLFVK